LDDEISPYDGGWIDGGGAQVLLLSAVDTLEFWRGKNSCNGPLERENFGSEAWCDADRNCQDDVETVMCTVSGGSGSGPYNHIIYNNSAGLDLAELSWDFFQSFTLAGDFQINSGLNDAWVNADAKFQGMFITIFPVLKAAFAAWFTFDSEQPPDDVTAVLGGPDQRWVTAFGFYDGNPVELKAELTTGGKFNTSNPLPTQDTTYGTITIEFVHCNLAIVEFDFPAAGESGSFTMKRAVDDNVILCEELDAE